MMTKRELQAFLVAPAATPFVFVVALVTARPAAIASTRALSILAVLILTSYLAAFLIARPTFGWLQLRTKSTMIQGAFAGIAAGTLGGIVLAMLLTLTRQVILLGNSGVLDGRLLVAAAGGLLGLVSSGPAIFTLLALLNSTSWGGMGPNPAFERTRRFSLSTWRASARRAAQLDRWASCAGG